MQVPTVARMQAMKMDEQLRKIGLFERESTRFFMLLGIVKRFAVLAGRPAFWPTVSGSSSA